MGFASTSLSNLSIPLDTLVIDEAALRTEAGFTTQPTQDDIDGTRRNMLNKVLETQQFTLARVHIEREDADRTLAVTFMLHGVSRTFEVPAVMQATPNGLIIRGKMHFNQTDFDITPFSILSGAI